MNAVRYFVPNSSYKTYISVQGEALVTRSTILEMFTTRENEARKRYKSFVESELLFYFNLFALQGRRR
jgi:hypothetical protein